MDSIELYLARPDAEQVEVALTCNGAFSHTFDLHALIPTEENRLPLPRKEPLAYGKILFGALFPAGSLARQILAQRPKRLLLVAGDDELDALPWEYAYGPDGFLVRNLPFVRALPAEQRIAPPESMAGVHIVAVASTPLSRRLAPLNLQGEWTRLAEIVQELTVAATLERAWPPTMERLRSLIANQQQGIVHFMGHGGHNEQGEAILCFEQDAGEREDITASEFVARLSGSVFLVTLNACESAAPGETAFSNLAAALVREQVPYALGMRFVLHDDDALAFARAFYSELARGISVERALLQARLTLAKSPRAWAIGNPVLYTALTDAAPGFSIEAGEPQVHDRQEEALRGIIGALPEVQGAFQGRIDEQSQLGRWLTGNQRPRIITIHGSGGQGKTALARVAAQRFAHAWPGGVWAFTLESVPPRAIFVASLARFLGLSPQDTPDASELERQVLLHLHKRRTLLVLDNLETLDEAVKEKNADALRLVDFILQLPSDRTSLLCTSRHLLGWSGEQPLELPGLSPRDGAQLFQQSAPDRTPEIGPAQAWQVSEEIDGHPLGLFLLGKAFNSSPITLAAFLADHETYLLAAENLYIGVEHRQRKLYANFAYSVRWLTPELRATLSQLWVFHAPFLPAIAVKVLDPAHDEDAPEPSPVEAHLYTLWQRGLLTREALTLGNETQHLYRLPPVMRPYVEHHLADTDKREETLKRFGEALAGLTETIYNALTDGRVIAALAVQCYDDLARGVSYVGGREQGRYLRRWGWILHWIGDQAESVAVAEQALAILREVGDRDGEGITLDNLGFIYDDLGQKGKALDYYEQALAIQREVGDRAGEGVVLNNLGAVYMALGQMPKALDFYEQALTIRREVGDRSGEGGTLTNLGHMYDALGQKSKSLDFYEQALAILREVGNRAGEGVTLNNLGKVCDDLGQIAKALDYYEQALAIQREVGDRAGEGATLNNLGAMYKTLGQRSKALDYYEQALIVQREVGDRAGEGATLNNLGHMYDALGQRSKALDYHEQALVIRREVGDLAGEGTTLNNLGAVYRDLGQRSRALDYFEQALAIHREVGNRAGEGLTLHNIGMIYVKSGQLDVALACVLLAKALFEYVQSPSDIEDEVRWIDELRTRLGEEQFALLFAQVEPRAGEIVEGVLRERRIAGEAERNDGGEASAGGTGDGV